MTKVKVRSAGGGNKTLEITIPVEIRDAAGIKEGEILVVSPIPGGFRAEKEASAKALDEIEAWSNRHPELLADEYTIKALDALRGMAKAGSPYVNTFLGLLEGTYKKKEG